MPLTCLRAPPRLPNARANAARQTAAPAAGGGVRRRLLIRGGSLVSSDRVRFQKSSCPFGAAAATRANKPAGNPAGNQPPAQPATQPVAVGAPGGPKDQATEAAATTAAAPGDGDSGGSTTTITIVLVVVVLLCGGVAVIMLLCRRQWRAGKDANVRRMTENRARHPETAATVRSPPPTTTATRSLGVGACISLRPSPNHVRVASAGNIFFYPG